MLLKVDIMSVQQDHEYDLRPEKCGDGKLKI